jgi:hypothetical protein
VVADGRAPFTVVQHEQALAAALAEVGRDHRRTVGVLHGVVAATAAHHELAQHPVVAGPVVAHEPRVALAGRDQHAPPVPAVGDRQALGVRGEPLPAETGVRAVRHALLGRLVVPLRCTERANLVHQFGCAETVDAQRDAPDADVLLRDVRDAVRGVDDHALGLRLLTRITHGVHV